MPCDYRIFANDNLVAKVYSGRVTIRCILKLHDDVEADQSYHDGMLEFDDMTEVTDMAITATDIGRFADLVTGLHIRKRRPTKRAILAPAGPGRVGAHGFKNVVENANDFEVEVFDLADDAFRFLGLQESGAFQRPLVLGSRIH